MRIPQRLGSLTGVVILGAVLVVTAGQRQPPTFTPEQEARLQIREVKPGLYVSTGRGRTVAAIDTGSGEVVGSVEVGTRPWGIALTADGRYLYVANGPSNDVSVIDTQTLTVIATIPAGERPWGVAIVQ